MLCADAAEEHLSNVLPDVYHAIVTEQCASAMHAYYTVRCTLRDYYRRQTWLENVKVCACVAFLHTRTCSGVSVGVHSYAPAVQSDCTRHRTPTA
jgi:hypothetical protein